LGLMDDLGGEIRVALDTSPIIYYIEANPTYLKIVEPVFDAIGQGQLLAVTSMVSLIEVLVHPLKSNQLGLANRYRDFLLRSSKFNDSLSR